MATTKTITDRPIRVAIIGLGFGAEFIPIYQRLPDADMHAINRPRCSPMVRTSAICGASTSIRSLMRSSGSSSTR